MQNKLYDAIVIGAGPAGATTANLLAQAGLDVLIVDRGTQPTPQIPQTCCGLRQELLARLRTGGEIKSAVEVPKPVRFVSSDGGFNFKIEIEPNEQNSEFQGMRLNRTLFDQFLVESAVRQGVIYSPKTVIDDCIWVNDRIAGVKCRTPEGVYEYSARVVIDASGKSSILANILDLKLEGEKLDDRVAVFSHFLGSDFAKLLPDGGMTVISIDGGYILLVPLLDERVSVVTVLADSKAQTYAGDLERLFRETVSSWPPLEKAIGSSQKVFPTLTVINRSWECKRFSGNGFLIVGEAASFLDPFFSNGVALAMDGGEIAADSIIKCFAQGSHWEGDERLSMYDEQIRALIRRRQKEAYEWIDSLATQRLVMSCADPHLPWVVPFTLLNLIFSAGTKLNKITDTSALGLISAARKTYSIFS